MSHHATRLLVLGCYAALAVVWAMTNPPFAAPDEAAHYLRAVGVSDGSLLGTPARLSGPRSNYELSVWDQTEETTQQRAWVDQATRSVAVPPGLSPDGFACELYRPWVSAACTLSAPGNRTTVHEITPVGTYQPLPYLLPASVQRLDHHAGGSLRLARLATVAMWLALLAVAIYALWDGALGAASMTGLVVAMTPMVVFVGSTLNGSSLEIMGSIAFFATLMALVRPGVDRPLAPRLLLAGATGVVLALSRSLGPVWVVLDIAVAVLLSDLGRARSFVARSKGPAVVAGASVLVGLALNRYWETSYGPHASISWLPSLGGLRAGVRSLVNTKFELVGNFGLLNVPLPSLVAAAWSLIAFALVIVGLRVGNRRERRILLIAVALALAVPIYLEAAVLRNTGFGVQGRHYLPYVAVVLLLAFELIRRHVANRTRVVQGFGVVAIATGGIQLIAWWINSRRYAVGSGGPLWFLGSAKWSPPLGWTPWLCVLLFAATALLALGAAALRAPTPDRDTDVSARRLDTEMSTL